MKHLLRWASAGLIFIGGLPQDAIAQDSAAANAPPPASGQAQQAYSHEELDAMLAPIALYPDDLVTQLLMASTYPLDIVAASRWLSEDDHKSLKGTALEAALKPLPWDPSVKSLVPFPVVLETMNQHLDWTQKLGYAMTVQQSDVFTSVQRLRAKAQASGHLQSNEHMTVSAEGPPAGAPPPPEGAPAQNIIIEPANPEVVYVPQYDPTVVYGDWGYSTPPYYYPPPPAYYGYYPGYYPGAALAAGFLWGAGWAIAGGLWGWARPGWGWGGGVYNNININANRYSNIGGGRWNGGGRWQGGNVGRPGGIGSAGRPGGVGGVGRPGGVGGVGGAGRPGGVGGVGAAGRPGGVGGAGGAGRPGGVGGAGRPGGVGGAGRPGGVGSAGRPGGAGQYGGRGGQYGGARGGQYGGARGSYGGSYGGARGSHGGSRGGYGARGGGHGGGARGGGSRGGGGRGGGGRGGGGRGGGRR